MPDVQAALALAAAFDPRSDDLARKSQELVLGLLRYSEAPFSRYQFSPGHITCTALILSPNGRKVLLTYHHRFERWLLPGGHVEPEDATLEATARREASEETGIRLSANAGRLVGMDVHGIPNRKSEPYHLHHDLIVALQAGSDDFTISKEAPQIVWCALEDFERYRVPPDLVRSAQRAQCI